MRTGLCSLCALPIFFSLFPCIPLFPVFAPACVISHVRSLFVKMRTSLLCGKTFRIKSTLFFFCLFLSLVHVHIHFLLCYSFHCCRFWHDQLFVKPPHHGGNVAYHQGTPSLSLLLSLSFALYLSVFVCLSLVTFLCRLLILDANTTDAASDCTHCD